GLASNYLKFSSNQTFNGPTFLTADGANQSLIGDSTFTVTGNNLLALNSPLIVENGTFVGNPLIVSGQSVTIAISNSTAGVTLPSSFIFKGVNLAILSAGNIQGTGATTIDLSSGYSNGGNLVMIAGYDFAPATSGQTGPDSGSYPLGSVSAAG